MKLLPVYMGKWTTASDVGVQHEFRYLSESLTQMLVRLTLGKHSPSMARFLGKQCGFLQFLQLLTTPFLQLGVVGTSFCCGTVPRSAGVARGSAIIGSAAVVGPLCLLQGCWSEVLLRPSAFASWERKNNGRNLPAAVQRSHGEVATDHTNILQGRRDELTESL